ncbi:hypothetical protein SAMN05660649_02954 [Desulfotomaculum arcticum]|uniref:Uncharacterized protein n=1 Tax=Desulfotruncus arcticus DSM 17038 TaxID=1121424 RepID=A0A1I2VFM0_9FIRM|nr:hypothetical protein [Desulfotruncus arcticus]SFG87229.1 hypothetical protein SAMN05660649_02954 [Desulfotomaculum arcticum] [Desulfotruncus arcticus DSM 17038]
MNKELIDTLISVVIIGIPECIVLTMLMLAFLQLPLIWKKIISVGIIQAITVIIFRLFANSLELPGLHTAAAVITLGLLVSFFWQASRVKALTCSIMVMIVLILLEFLYYNLFELLFTVNLDKIVQSKLYWALCGWSHVVTISFIVILVTKTKWYQKGLLKYTPFNHSGAR